METPLGLTYRPFFPIAQSIYKQAEQQRQLRAKQEAELTKTAETRAYNAVADLAKFHPERPYVHSIEPYFQEQTKAAFDLMDKVRKREIPSDAVYDHMMKMQADADKAKRYDAEVTTFMTKWKDSGNYDMQHITQKYANHTVDLQATQELGTVAWLPPGATDPNVFVNDTITDINSFNATALSQKFIADLERTNKEQKSEYDPAGNIISKETSLQDQFFSPQLGASGQHVLNVGAVNSDQSRVLLNRFRGMGPDWDNYLQLRAVNENPEFAKMQPGSDEWGVQMQKSLQNLMMERGFVGKTHTETAHVPRADSSDKSGTAYDTSYIGNSRKAEGEALDAARVLNRVINKDNSALSFFKGPNVESAKFSDDGSSLTIKMKEGKVDQLAGILSKIEGVEVGNAGEVKVPLTREALVELVNFKNAVSSRADWIGENVERAYDKLFPGQAAEKAAPEDPVEKQMRELRGELGAEKRAGAPVTNIKSHEEAIAKLKPGDKYIIDGKTYERVQE